MALQRMAVSVDPIRETSLSSLMVAFSELGMSKARAIERRMAHCYKKV